MRLGIRIITWIFAALLLTACSTQELQKFAYNTGAAVGCRHANDNLPNEEELDFQCLHAQGADDMTYETYIELTNEIASEPEG